MMHSNLYVAVSCAEESTNRGVARNFSADERGQGSRDRRGVKI